jgi:hypothetical protein
MQKITSVTGLKDAIIQLEEKQAADKQLLKEELHLTLEKLKPINLIKRGINEAFSSTGFIDDIFGAVVGNTAGFVSRKVLLGSSRNPFKKILGTLMQTLIASLLTKYGDTMKAAAIVLFKSVFSKKPEPAENTE